VSNVGTAASGKTLIGAGNGKSPTYANIGTNSGLTAHGVVVAEGNSAFAALSPGISGQVLTSNGASSDPSFQNPSSSGYSPAPIFSPGAAIDSNLTAVVIPSASFFQSSGFNAQNLTSVTLRFFPAFISGTFTFSKVGLYVNSTGAGSLTMFGIYDNTGTAGVPGSLLGSVTGINTASTGIIEGNLAITLTPGWYWFAIQSNASAVVNILSIGNNTGIMIPTSNAYINLGSLANQPQLLYDFVVTNTYGTFPSTPVTILSHNSVNGQPFIYLR
jgi:hypothetical protein